MLPNTSSSSPQRLYLAFRLASESKQDVGSMYARIPHALHFKVGQLAAAAAGTLPDV